MDLKEFFEWQFYSTQLGDSKIEATESHYIEKGWRLGFDPSPFFSTVDYLSDNPDISAAGENPLVHYLQFGLAEGRTVRNSRRVNPAVAELVRSGSLDYATADALVAAYVYDPRRRGPAVARFLADGWRFGRVPGMPTGSMAVAGDADARKHARDAVAGSTDLLGDGGLVSRVAAVLDADWYDRQCWSIGLAAPLEADLDAARHYLGLGRHFRLSPTPVFDILFYIEQLRRRGGLAIKPEDALLHYFKEGEPNGFRPCALIDPKYVREQGPNSTLGALELFSGDDESVGCNPSAGFWSDWYRDEYEVGAVNAVKHFYMRGLVSEHVFNPLFDIDWYEYTHKIPKLECVRHYLTLGFFKEYSFNPLIDVAHIGRQIDGVAFDVHKSTIERYFERSRDVDPSALFETGYYLRHLRSGQTPDQPLWHYFDQDAFGPKHPNRYFSDSWYARARPDLAKSRMAPLRHYLFFGYMEGASTHPLVDHGVIDDASENRASKTPIEAVLAEEAFRSADCRRLSTIIDPENRSKWLPVALDVKAYERSGQSADRTKVAVLAHVFYPDLMPEVLTFFDSFPAGSKLFISTDSAAKQAQIELALHEAKVKAYAVRVCPNRGRDIAPSFLGFRDVIFEYEYAVHIHTKKSKHYGKSFDQWRSYLYSENGGSRERVSAILTAFKDNPELGGLAPVDFDPVRKLISWGGNQALVFRLLDTLGFDLDVSQISLEFPSGSMFWFRVEALRCLFEAPIEVDHFDSEKGQVDGTLAHAIERAFFILIEASGYDWARFSSGPARGGYELVQDMKFAASRIVPRRSVRDPVAAAVQETMQFFVRVIDNDRPRLNLLLPVADLQLGYAGVSEALRQYFAIASKFGDSVDLRIVATDVGFGNMTVPPAGFAVSDTLVDDRDRIVAPGFRRGAEPLGLRKGDVFMASAWWNARQAFALLDQQQKIFADRDVRRIVYFIQDFEPGFYPWSTRWSLAENTYRRPDQTIAVMNTPVLETFMAERYAFSHQIAYAPMINESLRPSGVTAGQDREKIVLLYARPHAARNCLELIEGIVYHCRLQDPAFWRDWRFVAVGEDIEPQTLRVSDIETPGRLSLDEYRATLRKARLGVSFMVSPHPSYPPLEMAANGVKVLTNTYGQKDLSELHGNIISTDAVDPGAMAEMLRRMAETEASGKSRVDWFFGGKNNLDQVAESVAREIASDLGVALPD